MSAFKSSSETQFIAHLGACIIHHVPYLAAPFRIPLSASAPVGHGPLAYCRVA